MLLYSYFGVDIVQNLNTFIKAGLCFTEIIVKIFNKNKMKTHLM